MALEIEWFELYPDSRSSTIDRSNITKDFVFVVCGNFVENAEADDFGLLDDMQVQKAVYEKFAPLVYSYALSDTESYTLYLANCSIQQINWDHWKVTLQYDIPQDNGQSQGGGGGDTGPGQDEGPWSEEFTQVSFDTTPNTKTITHAKLIGYYGIAGAGSCPYGQPTGQLAPIGVTQDEIKGFEVPDRSFKFTVTQYRPPEKLRYAYVRKLTRMTSGINNDTFFGFPKGSVMFMGASGQGDLYKKVPVSYNFEVKPNFRFSKEGPSALCDPEQDDPTLMYDVVQDPEFPDAPTSENEDFFCPGPSFSGWSIVDYRYIEKVADSEEIVFNKPYQRYVFLHADFVDFSKFEL